MNNREEFWKGTPHEERRCTRCGKHVDDLISFGEQAGKREGKKLIKRFRGFNLVDYIEEYEMVLNDLSAGVEMDELIKRFGVEKFESALMYGEHRSNCEKSWECRDCITEKGEFKLYSIKEDYQNQVGL